MAKITQAEREAILGDLRAMLQPGDTVYTILRYVSTSGMSRDLSLVIMRNGNRLYLTHSVARLLGYRVVTSHGYDVLRIGGCGMDMGFAVVYHLGAVLFPDGFAVTGYGRNGDTSGWDKDGGYALRQEWL